jgi:cytochrome c-type biogenesis protein CcmH/NrfG
MFSSRNIHFALLGIILGSASGYIFAFYRVQSTMPVSVPTAQSSGAPQGHPNLSPEEVRRKVEEQLAKNPNDTQVMTLYANFLFDQGKFSEAVEWFQKAVAIQPDNLDVRTDMATALWNAGKKDQAMAEYQKILRSDPKHMATLHNLVIVHLEQRDLGAAEQVFKQMEAIDPKYEGLEPLKKRLAELKGK